MSELSYEKVSKKKNLMRYSFLFFVAICTLFIFLFKNEQVTATKNNTLTISGPWEISSLDPSRQGYILMRMQMIETLLNIDTKGKLISGLARSWEISDDGLTWKFELKKGILFHDSLPLNANAVVNSLNIARHKHGVLQMVPIIAIEVKDNSNFIIKLRTPYTSLGVLLSNYSTAILSPNSYDNKEIRKLYGTGAYQLFEFSPPHKVTVKKFDAYWNKKGKIDYVTYLTGYRAKSRILQAKSGEADIVFSIDPGTLNQLRHTTHLTVHENFVSRTLMIKLNSGHKFLNNRKIREALSLSIDRKAITSNILASERGKTSQLLPSCMYNWHLKNLEAQPFNLEKAQSMLYEMGWHKNNVGILVKNNSPFKLTMLTYADRPELTELWLLLSKTQWRKLGIELKINIINSSMIPAGSQDGSLESALITQKLWCNCKSHPNNA